MINAKTIIGVVIVAILVGVLYVLFEKNFTSQTLSNSQSSSSKELSKDNGTQTTQKKQSSLINLPTPNPTPAPLTESSDLAKEAAGLQMRDYSIYFEELKGSVSSQ